MDSPEVITGYVYLITNLVNGKKYVGCTRVSVFRRWKQHVSSSRNGSRLALHGAMRKHGVTQFSVSVLSTMHGTPSDLMAEEIRQIAKHVSVSPGGYNMTLGGEGVDYHVDEVRFRHHESVRERSESLSWRQNVSVANRRKAKDPQWLSATSEANRLKSEDADWQSASLTGAVKRSLDPKWREAVTLAARRRASDPEWRRKNSETLVKVRMDPEFQKAHMEGVRKRSDDKTWQDNVTEAAKLRALDPSWLEKNAKSLIRAHAASSLAAMTRDAERSPMERSLRIANREAVRRYRARKREASAQ